MYVNYINKVEKNDIVHKKKNRKILYARNAEGFESQSSTLTDMLATPGIYTGEKEGRCCLCFMFLITFEIQFTYN